MAETQTAAPDVQNEQPKVVSAGKVQRMEIIPNSEENLPPTIIAEEISGTPAPTSPQQEPPQEPAKESDAKIEFTEEQRKAFFADLGVDYTGNLDEIKEKLKPVAPPTTQEDKNKLEAEKELKLVNVFVAGGGTVDQFNAIKQMATADPKEFSKKEVISELKEAGFSDEEAANIAKERYYQIELDQIEQNFDNDESDADFAKRKADLQKKIDFGAKKLANHSSYKQQQAAGILKSLQEAINSEELQKQSEAVLSSNVDEMLKNLPRKVTYELGKFNDEQLAPVEHEVSEESIAKVAELLKDPAKRNNFFYNKDNSLNLTSLTQVLLNNFEHERAVKNALLEGQTRQVAIYEKVFPARTAYELGVGGAPNKNTGKGVVTSAGKPQRVMPTTINN